MYRLDKDKFNSLLNILKKSNKEPRCIDREFNYINVSKDSNGNSVFIATNTQMACKIVDTSIARDLAEGFYKIDKIEGKSIYITKVKVKDNTLATFNKQVANQFNTKNEYLFSQSFGKPEWFGMSLGIFYANYFNHPKSEKTATVDSEFLKVLPSRIDFNVSQNKLNNFLYFSSREYSDIYQFIIYPLYYLSSYSTKGI